MLGKLLNALRAPGFVRPFEYRNGETGETLSVRTSPRYTVLTVNGHEHYFVRETGKYDGSGMMPSSDSDVTRLRADRIQRGAGTRAADVPLGRPR